MNVSRNQFFYVRTETKTVGEQQVETDYFDSFNVEKVIRSITLEDGQLLVLLDDMHERMRNVDVYNHKGVKTGVKREKTVYQSEIYLKPGDAKRFRDITAIEA